jgi:hypothetical protein
MEHFILWSYGAVYSITTFIRAITSLLQIRQVARLIGAMEPFSFPSLFLGYFITLSQTPLKSK